VPKIIVEIEVPKGGGCIDGYEVCDMYFMKYEFCNLFGRQIDNTYKCSECKDKIKMTMKV
jgi:hypothetical protein